MSWKERFKKASITNNVQHPFGADSPAVLARQEENKGIGLGWMAIGVMGAVWIGYEIGVKQLMR